MVLGEFPCGKFTLVKLPRGKFPLITPPPPVVNSPAEYFPKENSPKGSFPLFINAFFIRHSLKIKRELVIA